MWLFVPLVYRERAACGKREAIEPLKHRAAVLPRWFEM